MKIALIQMNIIDNKEKNINKASNMIKEASNNGADIVMLPEMFNCPYENSKFMEYQETEKDRTISMLKKLAKENKILLIAGSIPEKKDGKIYNTSFVINKKGEVLDKHRKVHLFDIDIEGQIVFKESDTLSAGGKSTVVNTEFGKIGIAICYDMRFPELIRKMTLEGAKLICIPAAFNMTTGPAHWHTIAKSRSLDNQVYFAMCSPARNEKSNYVAYGHSLVANPWGKINDELDEKEGILYSEIEYEYLDKIRNKLPLLKHMREDIYKMESDKNE